MTTRPSAAAGTIQGMLISKNASIPFIGARISDLAHFEYILMDLEFPFVNIALPHWLTNTERLRKGEEILLNFELIFENLCYSAGTIESVTRHEKLEAELIKVRLAEPEYSNLPLRLNTPSMVFSVKQSENISIQLLFGQLLKDSIILKRGLDIYLQHLIPLFSRTGGKDETEFYSLRESYLNDLVLNLNNSILRLEEFRNNLLQFPPEHFNSLLPLSEIESVFMDLQTALPFEFFEIAFENRLISEYVSSIKSLERRLFANYNALAVLFCNHV